MFGFLARPCAARVTHTMKDPGTCTQALRVWSSHYVGALGGVDAMARGILSTECALAYLMGLVGGLVKPCLSDCGCILRSGCM
ncbi:hypothetical protein SCLCIDRAFT_408458 [Scleroderma citrinum Foug A]|uniref:Uncharacterized protein n=1 Tax=Scleroderma citrinum Foug A TaxID=1036808 RepID=A0A0C3DBQ0_9AGAM|nr:hypothetical protein SCLCIDRAFT_408458 [Scleroderma citrinum Foug A]